MKHEEKLIQRIIVKICFVMYLALLLYFLLFADRRISAGGVNLIPFAEIRRYLHYTNILGMRLVILNLGGNVIGFMPFGYLLASMNQRFRRPWIILLMSFCFSFLIELVQFITKVGCYDVDDILMNTLGGVLGCLANMFILKIRSRESGKQEENKK